MSMELVSRKSTDETTNLVQRTHKVDAKTADLLRKVTIIVSITTVVILGSLGIATLVVGIQQSSSAAFAFSLDALLDCLSSLVVLWRFWGTGKSLYSAQREKIACLVLGSLFIVSTTIIAARAGIALKEEIKPKTTALIWGLSIANLIMCTGFVTIKAYLAYKLESISIATDAVNSGIGVVLAISTIVGDLVYEHNDAVWYIDSILGCICAFFLFVYGVWIIIYETCISTRSAEDSGST